MEKRYAPYSKWLGIAFSRLPTGAKLTPILQKSIVGEYVERKRKLAQAYSVVAKKHNALRITKPLPTEVTRYQQTLPCNSWRRVRECNQESNQGCESKKDHDRGWFDRSVY